MVPLSVTSAVLFWKNSVVCVRLKLKKWTLNVNASDSSECIPDPAAGRNAPLRKTSVSFPCASSRQDSSSAVLVQSTVYLSSVVADSCRFHAADEPTPSLTALSIADRAFAVSLFASSFETEAALSPPRPPVMLSTACFSLLVSMLSDPGDKLTSACTVTSTPAELLSACSRCNDASASLTFSTMAVRSSECDAVTPSAAPISTLPLAGTNVAYLLMLSCTAFTLGAENL